jgi:hypothetical protein
MPQDEFRQTYGIDTSTQINLVKIVFMRYQHPDLEKTKTFLKGAWEERP